MISSSSRSHGSHSSTEHSGHDNKDPLFVSKQAHFTEQPPQGLLDENTLSGIPLVSMLDSYDFAVPAAAASTHKNFQQRAVLQKSLFWELHLSPAWFPKFFALLTAMYLAVVGAALLDAERVGEYVVITVFLVALPLVNGTQYKNSSVVVSVTAILLLVFCLFLDTVLGRQQVTVVYFTMAVTFRVIHQKTTFDNFALCLAYSADVSSLTSGVNSWFFTSKVFLWGYFVTAMAFYFVIRRTKYRVWQLIHVLLVLKEKAKKERELADTVISAHFPSDIVSAIFHNGDDKLANACLKPATDLSNQQNQDSSDHNKNAPPSSLIRAAIDRKILSGFEDSSLSVEKIRALDGFDRRFAVVLAIKHDVGDDRDYDLTTIRNYALYDLFDALAASHKITSVRKFGDVWIGCLGFAASFGASAASRAESCLQAIAMASQVIEIADVLHVRVSVAIDCGPGVVGGFVGSGFDLYGQEVRWVLSMVEMKQVGLVLVNHAVKGKVQSAAKGENSDKQLVVFEYVSVLPTWKASVLERVPFVSNTRDLFKASTTDLSALLNELHVSGRGESIDSPKTIANKYNSGSSMPVNWLDLDSSFQGDDFMPRHGNYRQSFLSSALPAEFPSKGASRAPHAHPLSAFDRNPTWTHGRSFRGQLSSKSATPSASVNGAVGKQSFVRRCLAVLFEKAIQLIDQFGVDTELGDEFHGSVGMQFGVLSSDTTLDTFSDEDVLELQRELSSQIGVLISEFVLNSVFKKVFLFSPQLRHGSFNESMAGNINGDANVDIDAIYGKEKPLSETQPQQLSFSPWLMFLPFDWDDYCVRVAHRSTMMPPQSFIEYLTVLYSWASAGHTLSNMKVRLPRRTNGHYYRPGAVVPGTDDDEKEALALDQHLLSSNLSAMDHQPSVSSLNDHSSDRSVQGETNSLKSSGRKRSQSSYGVDSRSHHIDIPTDQYYQTFKRDWKKYGNDARVVFHNKWMSAAIYAAFVLCTWYAIRSTYTQNAAGEVSSNLINPYITLFVMQVVVPFLFERQFDSSVFWFVSCLRVLYVWYIPSSAFCNVVIYSDLSNSFDSFGDLGGECLMLLLLLLWTVMSIRQNIGTVIVDQLLTIGIIYCRTLSSCDLSLPSFGALILFFLFRLSILWLIEYYTIFTYIVECELIPAAKSSHAKQVRNTRAILRECTPNIPARYLPEIYCPRRYRNCALVAVHVKPAALLASMLEPKDFKALLKQLYRIIDSCVVECGMLKVTQFSGVVMAVACKEMSWDASEGGRMLATSYTNRAVTLMKDIQRKMESFNQENNFHITVGIGIHHGSMSMGFLGNKRYSFDIAGLARDVACAMATYQDEGTVYASEVFAQDLQINKKGSYSRDLMIKRLNVRLGEREMNWLKIDGAYSGIDIHHFEYMAMLGQGGYGSVHLLRDKTTNEKYAIKAITKKHEGAPISKNTQREFTILQQMQHPNVVEFKYCIISKNRIYLVMSYIRGGNLKQIVERIKPNLEVLTYWFAELLLAIEYVHSLGIIHRDVKGANCMIGTDGHLRLADFGLSKIVVKAKDGSHSSGLAGDNDVIGKKSLQAIQNLLPIKPQMNIHGTLPNEQRSMEILLVEVGTISTNAISLRGMYCSVTVAKTISEAEAYLSTENCKYEIVLFDVDHLISGNEDLAVDANVPQDGSQLELLGSFCNNERFSSIGIPVVAVASEDTVADYCMTHGCKDVFSKPITSETYERMLLLVRSFRAYKSDLAEQHQHGPWNLATKLSNDGTSTPSSSMTNVTGNSTGTSLQPFGSSAVESDGRSSIVERMGADVPQNISSTLEGATLDEHVDNSLSTAGTIHFMAPEVLRTRRYDRSVDWWAFGVTFYESVARKHLFGGQDRNEIYENIINGPIDLSAIEPISGALQRLLQGLLDRDLNNRLGTSGAHKIKLHEFFQGINWHHFSENKVDVFVPPPPEWVVDERAMFYGDNRPADHDRGSASTSFSPYGGAYNSVLSRSFRKKFKVGDHRRHGRGLTKSKRGWLATAGGGEGHGSRWSATSHSFSATSHSITRVPEESESQSSENSEEGHLPPVVSGGLDNNSGGTENGRDISEHDHEMSASMSTGDDC